MLSLAIGSLLIWECTDTMLTWLESSFHNESMYIMPRGHHPHHVPVRSSINSRFTGMPGVTPVIITVVVSLAGFASPGTVIHIFTVCGPVVVTRYGMANAV